MTKTSFLARFGVAVVALWLGQALPGYAQAPRLDGMLDIAFGTSMSEAREAMLRQEGVAYDPVHSDANNLVCDGGSFAGEAVGFWLLAFVEDRMHTAKAIIQPEEARLLETYHALVERLTERYGAPTAQAAFFDDPYEAGDGFETYAIRFGKGHFAALWRFSDGENQNIISLSINDALYIPIVYQSGALIDLAIEQQEHTDLSGL